MFKLRLKELRKKNNMTQKQLADKLFVDCSSVTKWETGKAFPDFGNQKKLADVFECSLDYLLGRDVGLDYDQLKQEGFVPYNPKVRKIPVLGYVAAGLPIYADEHIIDYTYTEIENDGYEYFALKVKGDSMNAAQINDGNIVVVRVQQTVENGEIAVVRINNEDVTIKEFLHLGEVVQLIPHSFNAEHKTQIYDLKDTKIDIIGKVVECKIKF